MDFTKEYCKMIIEVSNSYLKGDKSKEEIISNLKHIVKNMEELFDSEKRLDNIKKQLK